MKVTIQAYAMAREEIGNATVEISVVGNSVRDVNEALHAKYPGLAKWSLKYAVNDVYVDLNAAIHESDTILVIPPVSGG